MREAALNLETNHQTEERLPLLTVVKGGRNKNKRHQRINDFWAFCHSALWMNEQFSPAEIEEFKILIAEHFKSSTTANKTFAELIRRVVLAMRYVQRSKGRYISKPADWLNIYNNKGLTGTKTWMESIEKQRLKMPQYNQGIYTLSKALKIFSEKQTTLSVVHYRKELLKAKEHELLSVLMTGIAFITFLND